MADRSGYSVKGGFPTQTPSVPGSRVALIAGNAETVFDDVEEARQTLWDSTIFAVNDVGMYLPTVHHWVSLHADKLRAWAEVRRREPSLGQEFRTHTSFSAIAGADHVWIIEPATFSLSGYFAMQLAYLMGFELIVLCGCPGDKTRRFFDRVARDDYSYGGGNTPADMRDRTQLLNEMKRVPELKSKVRSMSGWTQSYFGGLD